MTPIVDWITAAASLLSANADLIAAIASVVGALAALGALVAIWAVWWQVKTHQRQLKLDLENVYLVRYWVIMDDLLASKPGSAERRRNIARYLRLSEDQLDLRARDRITESTWSYWRKGICEQLAESEFADVLSSERPDLFDHIRQLKLRADYDPVRLGKRG